MPLRRIGYWVMRTKYTGRTWPTSLCLWLQGCIIPPRMLSPEHRAGKYVIFHEYYLQTARVCADNFSLQIASKFAVSAVKISKAKNLALCVNLFSKSCYKIPFIALNYTRDTYGRIYFIKSFTFFAEYF